MAAQWHVGRGGQTSGPYSSDQLQAMVERGDLSAGDLVWKEGMADWVDCATVQGLLPAARASVADGGPAAWNPYQSPTADGTAAADGAAPDRLVYADYLPRVGAYILDLIFITVFGLILAVPLGFVLFAALGPEAGADVAQSVGNLLGLLIGVCYYVGLETSEKQGTWGKQIVGIKVTDQNGRRLTVGRAFGRYFAHILTACSLGIGLLMPLFTEKRQTLHDMIAGCIVVDR